MVIADLYKGDVYELAYDINKDSEIIPINTLTKAPSAELHPGQLDSDSLPDYEDMDPILYSLNEGGKTPEELEREGVDKELLSRITSLMGKSSFKIHQIPPILNISSAPLVYPQKCLIKK